LGHGVKKRRIRVLVLVKGLGMGGAERLVVDLVTRGDRRRFEYEVAYVLEAQHALVHELEVAGVAVHGLGARASWDVRWLWGLRRLLLSGRFDIVHAHLPYSAAFGRIVARSLPRRRRPKLVYTEHSLWNLAAVLTKALNRATIHLDSALFVVSPASRDALPRPLRSRARVVVHGIDRDRAASVLEKKETLRDEVRSELGAEKDDLLALTVANMRSEKGYDVLLEAARLAVVVGAPIRFLSVGTGELAPRLEEARDASGLRGHLDFLGRRSDTLRLMAGCDLFVLPSSQEGMPVALMEAMSMGLPVVATNVGGVPDIVRDGVDGILVPAGRPDLLARALEQLCEDRDLLWRLAEGARLRSERFDIAAAARSIESVYEELVSTTVPLVLHVVPTAVARGAQREARALADGLEAPGERHHIVLSLFAGPEEVRVDDSLGVSSARPAVGFDPRVVLRLRAYLEHLDPAVVVAHGGDALKYLVPAMATKRRSLVYYAIGTFARARRPMQLALWRWLVGRADVVACEGEEVLEECRTLLRVDRSRLALAPNGRDPEEFVPAERWRDGPEAGPSAGPLVIFVGALTDGKGPDRFVESVVRLRDRGLTLQAVLCGDGPLREGLGPRAASAGVEMLGSRHDVPELLRGADILMFPSRPTGEGMPGVLIEAGLSGVPVVATKVPGAATIVEDGVTGILVDVDDVDAMTDATAHLLRDPELRRSMGSQARRRCEQLFGIDQVASRWLSFIVPLIAARLDQFEPFERDPSVDRPLRPVTRADGAEPPRRAT
jgi:glycosyltransferase involved in cell wall biosynthesis